MKKIILLYIISFWTATHLCYAQDSSQTSIPNFALKANFLGLIDPFNPAASLFIEHKVTGQFNLEYELGYLLSGIEYHPQTRGYRYRGMGRWYIKKGIHLKRKDNYAQKNNQFVGISYLYQQRTNLFYPFYLVYQDGRPIYERQVHYKELVERKAIAINYGFVEQIGKNTIFEAVFGVGHKWSQQQLKDVPSFYPDAYNRAYSFDNDRINQTIINHFTVGIKIGFSM